MFKFVADRQFYAAFAFAFSPLFVFELVAPVAAWFLALMGVPVHIELLVQLIAWPCLAGVLYMVWAQPELINALLIVTFPRFYFDLFVPLIGWIGGLLDAPVLLMKFLGTDWTGIYLVFSHGVL